MERKNRRDGKGRMKRSGGKKGGTLERKNRRDGKGWKGKEEEKWRREGRDVGKG